MPATDRSWNQYGAKYSHWDRKKAWHVWAECDNESFLKSTSGGASAMLIRMGDRALVTAVDRGEVKARFAWSAVAVNHAAVYAEVIGTP